MASTANQRAVMSWIEESDAILDSEKDIGEDLENMAVKIQEKASFCVDNCLQSINFQSNVWKFFTNLKGCNLHHGAVMCSKRQMRVQELGFQIQRCASET